MKDPIQALSAWLCNHRMVVEAADLSELLHANDGTDSARVLPRRSTIQVEDVLEISSELLIYDPSLMTLGIVFRAEGDDLEQAVSRSINSACFAVHLLRKAGGEQRQPVSVELVAVLDREDERRFEFGELLQRFAKRTTFLHAVSINVVEYSDGQLVESGLPRAFAWLLFHTRKRYEAYSPRGTAQYVESIELENYRMRGKRVFELDPTARVHLFHGRNGTGKSTLTEALELALTGAVQRLRGHDYLTAIRNRSLDEQSAVKIRIESDGGTDEFDVKASGVDPAVQQPIHANAFRLDQTFMTRVVHATALERARILLEAFFPAEAVEYDEFDQRREVARAAMGLLPSKLHQRWPGTDDEARARAFASDTGWIDDPTRTRSKIDWLAHLGVPVDLMARIARGYPDLEQVLSEWASPDPKSTEEFSTWARRIDEMLPGIFESVGDLSEMFEIADSVLRGPLQGWVAGTSTDGAVDFERTLNDALEKRALSDILRRRGVLARAVSLAIQREWDPPLLEALDQDQIGEWAEVDADSLLEAAEELARDGDALMSRLREFGAAPTLRVSESAPPPQLTRRQVEAFSEVGRFCFGAESGDLGELVDESTRTASARTFADLVIGDANFVGRLSRVMRECREDLDQLLSIPEAERSTSEHLMQMEEARRATLRFLESADTVMARFESRIESLQSPLNELCALFTPARWAYEDINLRSRNDEGRQVFGVELKGRVRADLIFNTAQLNTFSVALFLLCAFEVNSRYRLIVLDDPLQNMDELTVTTLARGMAKLVHVLPEGWRVVMLFHGEDDLERFRHELPAAVYKLEWLTPGDARQEPSIRRDNSLSWSPTLAPDLSGLLEAASPAVDTADSTSPTA